MFKTLLVITILFVVIASIFSFVTCLNYQKVTDALIDRAQVAADRDDMLEYMNAVKAGMEELGMTHGYTALLWKTPANDMSLHYKTVGRVIQRLESIKEMKKNDTAYQVALDDLREIIRDLENPANGWFWVKYGWWLLLIGIVLVVVTFIAYVKEEGF